MALGVLAAAVVLLSLVIVLVARACGGEPSGASAAASPSPTPTALRTPSAERPLRMAAYGDSVGGGALLGLKLLTAERKDIKVHRFVKVATGLARPDYFDWPAYLEQDMAKRKQPFEAVLVMLGANDGQNVVADGEGLVFDTRPWQKMYARRVGEVMDFYLKSGVKKVYWAGMPRMGTREFSKRMAVLNEIYRAEAAKRAPRVEYVDAWAAVDAPKDDVPGLPAAGGRRPPLRGRRPEGRARGAGRRRARLAPAGLHRVTAGRRRVRVRLPAPPRPDGGRAARRVRRRFR